MNCELTITGIRLTKVRQALSEDCKKLIRDMIPATDIGTMFIETVKMINNRESIAIHLLINLPADADSRQVESVVCDLGAQLTTLLNRVAHENPNSFIEGVGVEIHISKLIYSHSNPIIPT